MREAGKGSKRRPTDEKKVAENWNRIFGKPKRTFSSFIRETSPDEKAEVYEKVIDKATKQQQETLKNSQSKK